MKVSEVLALSYWIIQSLLYNIIWLICVKYPTHTKYRHLTIPLLIVLLLIQLILFIVHYPLNLLIPLFILTTLGLVMNQYLSIIGILRFTGHAKNALLPPFWFASIWLSFMIYVYPLLLTYQQYPLIIAALSAIGFVVAYWFAERLGAFIKTSSSLKFFTLIGVLHGFFFGIIETLLLHKVI
jgi:hypothetical protein